MEKCAATRKQWKNVLQQGNNGKMYCNKETMEKCAATRKQWKNVLQQGNNGKRCRNKEIFFLNELHREND